MFAKHSHNSIKYCLGFEIKQFLGSNTRKGLWYLPSLLRVMTSTPKNVYSSKEHHLLKQCLPMAMLPHCTHILRNIIMSCLIYYFEIISWEDLKIHRTKITKEASTYQCEDYPLIITLLHDNKKNSDSYQSSGNIILALESWNTIITWNN